MASTYTMVAYGSQGSAVKQLQSELNRRGYSLDEDGIFGKKTRAAVRDYQKKNGLRMVDGIAGDETWGSLLASPTAEEQAALDAAAAEAARPRAEVTESTARRLQELEKGYTPSDEVASAREYRDSVAALEPEGYESGFSEKLQALYDQIAGRKAFEYDPEEDEDYQRYAKLYAARGAAAMEDTLGKAAALTGGYGSSYAQTAGQQAYNGYLQELAALVPELRQAALAEYSQEGQALETQYDLLTQQEKNEYQRWQDGRKEWEKLLAAAQDEYESAGDRDQRMYQALLNHFEDKAEQEKKLSSSGVRLVDSGEDGGRGESLSSTAAESLQRAVRNYLKKGNGDLAQALNLKRSKYGRAIMAIRDNRIAAESVGLNVTWYKLAVFVIAAFFAGCAGVLYGHSLANIKAAAFDYNMSIEILVIVVLGGMGSVPGSIVSAIVLTVLPEALREVADYRMLVYAIVLILVMQATNNPTMKRFFGSVREKLTPKRKERAAL